MTTLPASTPLDLQWSTRAAARHLLLAFVTSLGITLSSGLLLEIGHAYWRQTLLVGHLAAGGLTLFFFIPFVVGHWRNGGEPWHHLFLPFLLLRARQRENLARHRLLGIGLIWALAGALLSGLVVVVPAIAYLGGEPFTLPYGSHVWLLQTHLWTTPLVVVLLVLHMPKEDKS